jgi:hypothetical protein
VAILEPYTLEQAETDIASLRGLVDRMSEVITKNDSTDSPTIPAAGIIHHSTAGQHKYASSDGSLYNTGRLHILVNASQTISSTTPAIVGANSVPLSCPVKAATGTYHVHGIITCVQGATADVQNFRFNGPAVAAPSRMNWKSYNLAGSAGLGTSSVTDIGVTAFGTPAWAIGATFFTEYDGHYVFTADGTLSLVAAESTNLHTFAIAIGSFMIVEPAA